MSKFSEAIDRGCRRVFIGVTVVVFAGSALSLVWAIGWGISGLVQWLVP